LADALTYCARELYGEEGAIVASMLRAAAVMQNGVEALVQMNRVNQAKKLHQEIVGILTFVSWHYGHLLSDDPSSQTPPPTAVPVRQA